MNFLVALIPVPYRILALALFAASLMGFGYVKGLQHAQGESAVLALSAAQGQKAAITAAVTRNELEHQHDLQRAHKAIDEYEAKIQTDAARIAAERAVADGLRYQIKRASVCGPAAPAQTSSAVDPDGKGPPEYAELPIEVERGLRDIAEDADREVARLHAKVEGLQGWIRAQGFYGPAPIP